MEDDYVYSGSKGLPSGQTASTPSNSPSKEANPAAELLQDMIREKRAKSQRTKKAFDPITRLANGTHSDLAQKETQSSPISSLNSRGLSNMANRRASGAIVKPPVQKEMGLREMCEHISKIDKQNFDLKLEVFHRRQRTDILETRIQKLEAYETDFEDLQAKYTALLLESDRQRLVLDDAVAQICELQSENEELQATLGGHFAGIGNHGAGDDAAGQILSSNGVIRVPTTPPQAAEKLSRLPIDEREKSESSSRSLRSTASRRNFMEQRTTNGIAEHKPGSHDLYSSANSLNEGNPSLLSVNRSGSVFSGEDEELAIDRQMLHSPRLSILSESGFSSIYGSPHENSQPSTHAEDNTSSSPTQSETESTHPKNSAQRDTRIDLWMQDKTSSPKSTKRPTPKKPNKMYTSIEEVLSKRPIQQREEIIVPHVQIPPRQSSSVERPQDSQRRRERKTLPQSPSKQPRSYSSSNGSMVFGGKMPPTPDTMSTATIGGPSSSTQSIITEKSLLDYNCPPGKGYIDLLSNGGPHTSDSDAPQSVSNTFSDPNGSESHRELSLKRSDEYDEVRTNVTDRHGHGRPTTRQPMGDMTDSDHRPTTTFQKRPAFQSYQTDMMFNGDNFALVQPSRTLSYPSPRRRTGVSPPLLPTHSPTKSRSQKGSGGGITNHSASFNSPEETKEAAANQTKSQAKDNNSFFVRSQQTLQETPLTTNEATRSKFSRFQFFKRSNSQSAGHSYHAQAISPSRPATIRSSSSTRTRSHSSKPRESSGIGSRPGTSDGPTPSTLPHRPHPPNVRRHSGIFDHATSFLPGGAAALREHSRRLSESRQTVKNNDDNSSRWPLGRNTSAKIKEGLGLTRSMVS